MRTRPISRRTVLKAGALGGMAAAMSPLAAYGRGRAFLQGEALTGTLESWTPDTRDDALAAEKWWGDQFKAANPGVERSEKPA